jgi:toxin YoeB
MRDILLKERALEHLSFFAENDRRLLVKIFELIRAINTDPFNGIGKPEALKGNLKGYWSRRISQEHRIIYAVTQESIIIIACKSHYQT